jgi:hypothetical protein
VRSWPGRQTLELATLAGHAGTPPPPGAELPGRFLGLAGTLSVTHERKIRQSSSLAKNERGNTLNM